METWNTLVYRNMFGAVVGVLSKLFYQIFHPIYHVVLFHFVYDGNKNVWKIRKWNMHESHQAQYNQKYNHRCDLFKQVYAAGMRNDTTAPTTNTPNDIKLHCWGLKVLTMENKKLNTHSPSWIVKVCLYLYKIIIKIYLECIYYFSCPLGRFLLLKNIKI